MKTILYTLFYLSTFGAIAQKIEFKEELIKPKTLKIVKALSKTNEIHSAGIGFAGERSDQYDRFAQLDKTATKDELRILTAYPSPAVRGYAFWLLTARKDKETFEILKSTLEDTTTVTTFFGCIIDKELLVDFYINLVTPDYIDDKSIKLTANQKQELDSLLLYSTVNSYWKSRIISDLEPLPKHYHRLKEIIQEEGIPTAYVAIAKYKKEQDLELLRPLIFDRKLDYYGMQAIREFPSPFFLEDLKEIHDKEIRKPGGFDYPMIVTMYEAIAQFDSETARELFQKTIDEGHPTALKYHLSDIVIAIGKYPNPLYKDIKSQIKLNNYQQREVNSALQKN
jgi:hypothetical protein